MFLYINAEHVEYYIVVEMRTVEYPFYMANVLCVINSSFASRIGSTLAEYEIR